MRSLDDTLRHLLPWDTGIELVIDEPVDEYEEEQSSRLSYTQLVLELEHPKIETRLITEMFTNAMGESENEMR